MKSDDVALIQRILAGDETAFANLVRKYKNQVHALAWQKTRDFHIAEDIVQETFLQVYRKLETLEDPTQFSRWLHQIADRLCIAWFRKNKIQTEPLGETDISEVGTEAYSRYVAAEHAKTSAETQRDLVEKLLAKLKERDREVITLHYFEEMTSSEIGTFLGVSENTIKSQLHRARQRLKKYEFMIQEALDITIEGEHRSQKQLKGEISMTKEVRDESKIEASLEERLSSLEEMQNQLIAQQEQIQTHIKELQARRDEFSEPAEPGASIEFEPQGSDEPLKPAEPGTIIEFESQESAALKTLCRLPDSGKRAISWGYVGAYRTAPNKTTSRQAFWWNDLDDFLSKVQDANIANFANIFTDPTVSAVLRQLMESSSSVKDLSKECDIPESEVEKAVETLMDATLVARTENDLIEPKNDAVSFFLNFVSMTIVHLGHIRPKN